MLRHRAGDAVDVIDGLGTLYHCRLTDDSPKGAEATIRAIDEDYDVVMWEKHGVFAVDTDIMSAFDQVDVLNKSALIYIAARGMGFEPDGMTDAQMKELSDVFKCLEKTLFLLLFYSSCLIQHL